MSSLIKKLRYYFEALAFIQFIENWYLIPLGYLGLIDLSSGPILRLKNGLKFKIVHYFDALALKENFFNNDYRFASSSKPITVIDIGANIGDSSIYFASRSPKAKIVAIEPSKETFKQLQENIMLNNFSKQIMPLNLAVYKKKTKIKLFNPGPSGQRSLYQKRGTKKFELVSTITMKEIFQKYKIKRCDFLKLDCEGAEYDILTAIPETLFPQIRQIALECHPVKDHNPQELQKFLEKQGFRVHQANHHIEKDISYLYATRP